MTPRRGVEVVGTPLAHSTRPSLPRKPRGPPAVPSWTACSWWALRGSNPRPSDYAPATLPTQEESLAQDGLKYRTTSPKKPRDRLTKTRFYRRGGVMREDHVCQGHRQMVRGGFIPPRRRSPRPSSSPGTWSVQSKLLCKSGTLSRAEHERPRHCAAIRPSASSRAARCWRHEERLALPITKGSTLLAINTACLCPAREAHRPAAQPPWSCRSAKPKRCDTSLAT